MVLQSRHYAYISKFFLIEVSSEISFLQEQLLVWV